VRIVSQIRRYPATTATRSAGAHTGLRAALVPGRWGMPGDMQNRVINA